MTPADIATIARMVAQQLEDYDQRHAERLRDCEAKVARLDASRGADKGGRVSPESVSKYADQLAAGLQDAMRRSLAPRDERIKALEARIAAAERRLSQEAT